jgi:hypothetical protein
MNAFLLVVIIFAGIYFFFTVKLVSMADHRAVNDYYPIEGTEFAVRYSSQKPNGIYRGEKTTGVLLLEGDFGYDWGCAAADGALYINEYRSTDLGLMFSDLVRVDTRSFKKELLARDTVLRGRCASGELVCMSGYMLPSDLPETNRLCGLYSMAGTSAAQAEVLFLDPVTGETVFSVREPEPMSVDFEAKYLRRTLGEVMG